MAERPYTGFDKVATRKFPAVEQFAALCFARWGFTNLGTLVVRVMRAAPASIRNLPVSDPRCIPWMSIHATGRAVDLGFENTRAGKAAAVQAMNWFTDPVVSAALGIEEVHDYQGLTKKGTAKWGRGFRCNRGWKDWSETDNGQPGGAWIHVELSPKAAALSAAKFELVWRALPRPKAGV